MTSLEQNQQACGFVNIAGWMKQSLPFQGQMAVFLGHETVAFSDIGSFTVRGGILPICKVTEYIANGQFFIRARTP